MIVLYYHTEIAIDFGIDRVQTPNFFVIQEQKTLLVELKRM